MLPQTEGETKPSAGRPQKIKHNWVRKLWVGHGWRLFESLLTGTRLRTINQRLGSQFCASSKFSSNKAQVKEKRPSKLTLYNYSTMMLMHEIHVFQLLIEVIFQCFILAVVTVSYVVAGKAWKKSCLKRTWTLTAAVSVQCFTSWAIRPTESWL